VAKTAKKSQKEKVSCERLILNPAYRISLEQQLKVKHV